MTAYSWAPSGPVESFRKKRFECWNPVQAVQVCLTSFSASSSAVWRRIAALSPTRPTTSPKFPRDDVSGGGPKIERCDDCWNRQPDPLLDEDIAQLPEARRVLAVVRANTE